MKRIEKNSSQLIKELKLLNDRFSVLKQELQLSEAKWETTFNTMRDSVTIIDTKNKIIQYNSATMKMFDLNAGEIKKKNCWQLLHGLSKPVDNCPLERMKKTKQSESMTFIKGGKWLKVSVDPIFNDEEVLTGAVHVVRDITERKKVEEKLINSEKRFRQIAENSQEWIWEVDTNGLYTFVNQIEENMLGYKNDEIVGKKHFFDLFLPEEREKLKELAFKTFKQHQTFRGFINRNIASNGKIIWLSTSGVPILDENKNLLGYRGADINITNQKKVEEELKKHREHLEELVKKRTRELEEKNAELERFNKLFVDRELRIKELRDKVKSLKGEID